MAFSEQVRPPLGWWVLAVLFSVSLGVAIGYYLGLGWFVGTALGSLLVIVLAFRTASFRTEVDAGEVRVGRAVIGREWIGGVHPLDATATRRQAGVDADARAHLVLRPWVPTTVQLDLVDPADPVPYWLVSTRRPRALAAALGWEPAAPLAAPADETAPHG